MDLSYDYLAFDYVGNFQRPKDVFPHKQYTGGARTEDNAIYRVPGKENTNPVLLLEYDILNKEGFGLKKGFYEIRPDENFNSLMFIQMGKICAKIPVIKKEAISEYGNSYEWPDNKKKKKTTTSVATRLQEENDIVSPKKIVPELTEKEARKRDYKYKKGIDPMTYVHSKVEMVYDKEYQMYIIIWEKYNTRVTGLLKIR